MDGMQTTLRAGRVQGLEEFVRNNAEPLRYVLDKYKVWKQLKELEKGDAANELQESGTL